MRRRDLLAAAGGAVTLGAETHKPAAERSCAASGSLCYPDLCTTRNGEDTIRLAFHFALGDLFSNIRMYKSGLLENECACLAPGADYTELWTRDSAINVWNGVGLLFPQVAKSTLLSCINGATRGLTISGQYWDKIILTLGAWQHYLYTGDRAFLSLAFEASRNTLSALERDEFDAERGLFRGPAVYGDGVSAYPPLYTHTGQYTGGEWVSTITKWVSENPSLRAQTGFGLPMHALSTNCLYCEVYATLPRMAQELDVPANPEWKTRESNLREAINREFWDSTKDRYRYLVDPNGDSDCQEGLGLAFALLFGVADEKQREAIFQDTHVTPAGIPCLWPPFARYVNAARTSYGRHSGTVWPHIQAFWGHAAAANGQALLFAQEFETLTAHAWRDKQFVEIYHPDTGLPYGGIQESNTRDWDEWKSCDRQSWSASGYVRLVLMGLFGMAFDTDGIRFRPCLPWRSEAVRVQGLRYRDAELDIHLTGHGTRMVSIRANGVAASEAFVPVAAQGKQRIEIELTSVS